MSPISARADNPEVWESSSMERTRSPIAVPPGLRVVTTSKPFFFRCSASSVSWVLLPVPSSPSNVTNRPRRGNMGKILTFTNSAIRPRSHPYKLWKNIDGTCAKSYCERAEFPCLQALPPSRFWNAYCNISNDNLPDLFLTAPLRKAWHDAKEEASMSFRPRFTFHIFSTLVVTLILLLAASAQNPTGAVVGTITDPQG